MSKQVAIKICGLKDPANMHEVVSLNPQYIGFIFYPLSARFVGDLDIENLRAIKNVKKTAVFVNSSLAYIKEIVNKYQFEAVQLHGNEDPELCKEVKKIGVEVIKAFGVDNNFDFSILEEYLPVTDYFLFDTKTSKHGGSGKTFDWDVLKQYPYSKPYFLSGGISPDNFMDAYTFEDDRLYALDLNSRFELSPGVKNINLLKQIFKTNR